MLARVAEGPFPVVSVTDTTVVTHVGERQERISRERVVEAPSKADLLRREVLRNEDEEDQTKSAAKDAGTNENNVPDGKEYIIYKIEDHSNEEGSWMFRVRWYGFLSSDDTWEPFEGLPRSTL